MTVVNDLVSAVQKKFEEKEFDKFIYSVNFPKFKNFAPHVKIDFRYPITLIVGPNGGGKTSILHAVWGMPLNHSTSRFWFSTPVDPIKFDRQNPNRYWYSHFIKAIDLIVETRKMFGRKRHGYWEPTRPVQSDGMSAMPAKTSQNKKYMSPTGDRWTPVERGAHYFNAKAETSAFDRFFSTPAGVMARQSAFYKYSRKLKEVIDNGLYNFIYYGKERVSENYLLSQSQLDNVNTILQKSYRSARYISHRFYDSEVFSPSVIFETSALTYSECFAGSGELAVVNYILRLESIKQYDLLLLDEPETSLHPGAQEKLIEHLLRTVINKQVQVIISTHSTTLVQLLPPSALVVLDDTPKGIAPREFPTKDSAFDRLGATQFEKEKITILTEDRLLKALVDRSILKLPKSYRKKFRVIPSELGASEMLSNQVRAHVQANAKLLMVLDGDQSPVRDIFELDPDELSSNKKKEIIEDLKKHNVSIIGSITDLEGWMRWCKEHIILIDKICPEQILLRLIDPANFLLEDKQATNKKFKEAVKSVLKKNGNESTTDAQCIILKLKLGEGISDLEIDRSIQSLASNIMEKVSQFS
jgi:predicted ATPase